MIYILCLGGLNEKCQNCFEAIPRNYHVIELYVKVSLKVVHLATKNRFPLFPFLGEEAFLNSGYILKLLFLFSNPDS